MECITKIIISIKFLNLLTPSIAQDCSQTPAGSLPKALIYDASLADIIYGNHISLEKPSGQNAYLEGYPGFECVHNKAIRWVLNLDYQGLGVAEVYSVTTREVTDFYNTSSYVFKADLELNLQQKDHSILVSCIAYDNICERSTSELVYNATEKAYILRYLDKEKETSEPMIDFISTVDRNQKYWRNEDYNSPTENTTCAVNFSMSGNVDDIFYSFIPRPEHIHPRSIQSRQTLENAYSSNEYLDPKCVHSLCRDNYTLCYNLKTRPDARYWPLVFYMTDYFNLSRVVLAYKTLVTRNYSGVEEDNTNMNGTLKFAWEYSDKRDFIFMHELPEMVYYNSEIKIGCKMSQFMYSFGTKIAYSLGSKNEFLKFLPEVDEPLVFGSSMEANGKIFFKSENFTELDTNLTVYCFGPVANSSSEWVNVSRTTLLTVPKISISLPATNNSKVLKAELGSPFNILCKASGPPIPNLQIELPENTTRVHEQEKILDDTIYKTLYIPNVDGTHEGFYNCVATNSRGVVYSEFEIKIYKNTYGALSNTTIILISVFASISAIFLLIVIILLVRFRLEKEEFRRLTEEAIREFQEGLDASLLPSNDGEGGGPVYANDSIKTMPYEGKYEVSHKLWTIDNTLLGAGAFGIVRRGTVEVGARKSVVAVKTVKCPDDIENFKATLLELKIMAHVGHHRHIVKLIAASTEEIQNRKVLIAVEFCSNGSLLEYLQKRKKLFNNIVQNGEILFPSKEKEDGQDDQNADDGPFYTNLIVTSDISTIDLYKWSYQIASGMDFLESKKVLHADLAARNILLTEELVVKISDFGLSRDLFENSEYTKQTQVALPWKWMAIESLKFLKFSTKSDVWSYGVTLYEVFTLGEEPYLGQAWTEEFVQILENGMRLNRPEYGTTNVYTKVMMPCWRAEPNERIRFADAMEFFEKAIELLNSKDQDKCREFC